MRYSERTIPSTPSGLKDAIVFTMAHASSENKEFPAWTGLDFDGAFYQLFVGAERLRSRFGDIKTDNIIDMLRQSKAHFEEGDIHRGSWLTQDIERIIDNKAPFAYPEDEFRWK